MSVLHATPVKIWDKSVLIHDKYTITKTITINLPAVETVVHVDWVVFHEISALWTYSIEDSVEL